VRFLFSPSSPAGPTAGIGRDPRGDQEHTQSHRDHTQTRHDALSISNVVSTAAFKDKLTEFLIQYFMSALSVLLSSDMFMLLFVVQCLLFLQVCCFLSPISFRGTQLNVDWAFSTATNPRRVAASRKLAPIETAKKVLEKEKIRRKNYYWSFCVKPRL